MRRDAPVLATLFALLVALIPACGDDSTPQRAEGLRDIDGSSIRSTAALPTVDGDTAGGGALDAASCAILQQIADADDAFQEKMGDVMTEAGTGDPAALEAFSARMQELMNAELPALLDAYDRLTVAAPGLADDVRTVRDFTAELGAELGAAGSFEEMAVAIDAALAGEARAAGMATLRIDRVSRRDCGVVIAD